MKLRGVFKGNSGHMYLESVFAILLIGLVFPVIMGVVMQANRTSRFAGDVTVATSLAKERLEFFKRYERTRTYNRNHNVWTSVPQEVITINGVNYTVRSRVIPNAEIPNTNIRANLDIIPIEVTVTWNTRTTEGTGTRAISLVSYFMNY
ncbi:MAG TPA: hypothetical protein GX391_05665 [Firmicutes bacterium]|jgi:hypothetical protein|nr:hypothetical protein [Bacillota bacterium]HOQ23236.1 hypothetical protein [Bacillota bacterium]HPT66665.1 hypothetical protein [Bacillota bacterium]